ncbi:N-formylglutamate amidohydrolase [Alteraurantiacibacter aestuarii]|uniref:N-formylglutamate amidohydrolase n=1 Tax=Alteraurantiacibacter aestuarii TaxID=650004 RepID=A0A844ZJH0_9SPHN|nr:N-formylglutamate amidohydrolase [Alteraurantiacibacter aestuarii]MXO87724.1 N-formylglutamate amidohydrolase [Alteraurantiacibacter aestuarii]
MVDEAAQARDSGGSHGGHLPGDEGKPAFEMLARRPSPIPVLIAVPHAGRTYPEALLARMRFPDDACVRLEDRLADLVARDVARETGAALLVAHAPRAMIDLNRAPEDMDWDMVAGDPPPGLTRFAAGRRARSGLGLVPRRLPGMGELWKGRMSSQDLAARLDLVHRPYHSTLAHMLESLRDRWGSALLIDLHSMPPLGPKSGQDPSPDFVIGDRYGSACSAHLSLAAFNHFASCGRRAAHNRPYAGGYVLDRHASPARGLHAMQVEICRTTYLEPALREAGDGLGNVVNVLSGLVRRLAEDLLAGSGNLAQAAE